MKAFTDIEQSKKLAEILSSESADMCWCNNSIKGVNYTDEFSAYPRTFKEMKDTLDSTFNEWDKYWKLIPCWSLSALLDILPNQFNKYTKALYWFKNAWKCDYTNEDFESEVSMSANNPVDACVKMVFELKRLIDNNLL